jgi:hypothetical protein
MIPAAVGRLAQQVIDVELGGAEERIGLLLFELDDLADDDARGGGRHPAVFRHLGLAAVAVQMVHQRPQVLEVDERQPAVVGVLEGEGEHALLRVVELEHLAQQDRPKARDRCPQTDPGAVAVEGQELDRVGGRRIVGVADGGRPGGDLVVRFGRRGETRDVALDVADEGQDPGDTQLLGQHLERLRLPGPRRTGNEAVPVEHGERHANREIRMDRSISHGGAEDEAWLLEGVAGTNGTLEVGRHGGEYRRASGTFRAPAGPRRSEASRRQIVTRVLRDYGLSIVLAGLFFVSWLLQATSGLVEFAAAQQSHGEGAQLFGESGYIWEFLARTFENWESEFLQLFTMVVLTAFLIHKGSTESKDSDEDLKMMLNRIEQRVVGLERGGQ